ncbi:hypothetical protein OHV35_02785 [Acinetobacter baumannii]|nr:hypothetical protein [Acinetobacter baumannii]MDO7329803.1 hypothetical protein [Acinetobacter baumannii]
MKKTITLLLFFCMTVTLTACSQKEIYLTPEVTGYVYNNATKEPLRQQEGFIGFNGLTPNDAPELVLNKDGSFTLKPIAKKYYFFKPDMHEYSNMAALIYISFDGFKVKDIDYSEEKYKRIKADEGEFRPYKKVNLGVVYLNPEK